MAWAGSATKTARATAGGPPTAARQASSVPGCATRIRAPDCSTSSGSPATSRSSVGLQTRQSGVGLRPLPSPSASSAGTKAPRSSRSGREPSIPYQATTSSEACDMSRSRSPSRAAPPGIPTSCQMRCSRGSRRTAARSSQAAAVTPRGRMASSGNDAERVGMAGGGAGGGCLGSFLQAPRSASSVIAMATARARCCCGEGRLM